MNTTLLITTYNRAQLLHRSLARLCILTRPDEVLVIDDGGSDDTEYTCSLFAGPLNIRYIYNHNPEWTICSFARNIGIKEATGDLIITSEPELIFLTDVVDQFKKLVDLDPTFIYSAGTVYHGQHKAQYDKAASGDLTSYKIEEYNKDRVNYSSDTDFVVTRDWVAPFTACYRREWLLEVNGWDEAMPGRWGYDDIDLLTRLRLAGHNQKICPEIHVLHQWHPPGWVDRAGEKNAAYFAAKDFDNGMGSTHPLIKANEGKPWGIIRTL